MSDHTVGPVLTVTNQTYLQHIDALLKIKGKPHDFQHHVHGKRERGGHRGQPESIEGREEHTCQPKRTALLLVGLYQTASDSFSMCACVCGVLLGAYVAWGGKLLEGHSIPPCYGSWHPTAVYVPIEV